MMNAAWLIAALLAIPQDKEEGERLLEKAERALTSNVFLQINVKFELHAFRVTSPHDGGRVTMRVSGATLEFRPVSRFRIDGAFPMEDHWDPKKDPPPVNHLVIESDGMTTRVTPYEMLSIAKRPTPPRLGLDLIRDFLRRGVRESVVDRLRAWTDYAEEAKVKPPEVVIRNLGRQKLDDIDAFKLEITEKNATGPASPHSFLWIDTKSYKPLRRETRAKGVNWEKTLVESYSEIEGPTVE